LHVQAGRQAGGRAGGRAGGQAGRQQAVRQPAVLIAIGTVPQCLRPWGGLP
jgi:hypothetical protein